MSYRSAHSDRVESVRCIAAGKWLRLEALSCVDRHGRQHTWETAERQGKTYAVLIVARLRPSGRYVLIRQFRPPARADVIEFPAGLVDAGETPGEAALRELREETGYVGQVRRVTPRFVTSPGLTGETAALVFVDVDEAAPANLAPQPCFDAYEDISVHALSPADVPAFLEQAHQHGAAVDIKVAAFFAGR